MTHKFFGGPYDGWILSDNDINRRGMLVPVETKAGRRLFALMPPRTQWDRFEGLPRDGQAMGHAYEAVPTSAGVEFHEAKNGELGDARAEALANPPGAGRINERFAARADEFEKRVRAAELTPTTEVNLVYYCVDEQGVELPPFRASVVGRTAFGAPEEEAGRSLAAAIQLQSIIKKIDAKVRRAPDGSIRMPGASLSAGRIVNFELEISDVK
jgi:hypothetical protein